MKYLLLLALLSLPLQAATTATLVLQGHVPKILNLVVTPTSTASNLDLSTSQTNVNVASVSVLSNSSVGYNLTFSSANSGVLSNGSATIPYTLKLDSTNVTLNSPLSYSNFGTTVRQMYISYVASSPNDGTYTDTITITLTSN